MDFEGVSTIIDGRTGREYSPGEYTEHRRRQERSRLCRRFIKGPIPVAWMASAIRLRGSSATKVAVALFYQRGLRKDDEFRIEPARFRELGIDDTARRRGLKQLKSAGLIEVTQRPGQSHVITMVGVEDNARGGS